MKKCTRSSMPLFREKKEAPSLYFFQSSQYIATADLPTLMLLSYNLSIPAKLGLDSTILTTRCSHVFQNSSNYRAKVYTSGRTAAVVPNELPIRSYADMTFDIVDVAWHDSYKYCVIMTAVHQSQ